MKMRKSVNAFFPRVRGIVTKQTRESQRISGAARGGNFPRRPESLCSSAFAGDEEIPRRGEKFPL
jgi:hypothetical protein